MKERPLLTVKEIAAHLRLSGMSVYRLIESGDLPAIRIGRTFRVYEDEFEKWLASK